MNCKHLRLYLCLFISIFAFGFNANAQSAKATAKIGNINVLNSTNLAWSTVLSNRIKTANMKDLFISVSMECGLYTQTLVRSKGGTKDTSSAEAVVRIRVLIDGKEVAPGAIIFCKRMQELSAKLGGYLDQCQDANNDGIISIDECELVEEEIELIQDTMSANAFNFIKADLSAGDHKIEIQAAVTSSSSSQAGSASANATIGNGSMTVEEVRMVKGEDINL